MPNILDRVKFRAKKISTNRTLSNEINSLGGHNNPTSLHSKQMQEKWVEIQGEIDKTIVRGGNFNIPSQ